ncbi:MAG TPA: allantoinase PuuE [Dongiaceae bacterium]|nr:allantoinase PuuE [Dongiaceae bacterium]
MGNEIPDSGRDLTGYGAEPPHPRWPGNARIALNFVVNYEEGAEYSLLNGDDRPETILSEVGAGPAVKGLRDLNMESMYEYGARAGVWRVLRAFQERNVVPTVYAVGLALERNPRVAEAVAETGCDVVAHGWRWIDYAEIDEATERDHIRRCVDTIGRMTGKRPVGWYTGRPSLNTRRLVVEEGGFLYDGDAYADDLPYWVNVGQRAHLIVPHSFDHNDSRMARNQDLPTPELFFDYMKAAFDALYAEGEASPKFMTLSTHCRLIGRPGRIAGLTRFLDHVLKHDRVWICRRAEVARHWRRQFPQPRMIADPAEAAA